LGFLKSGINVKRAVKPFCFTIRAAQLSVRPFDRSERNYALDKPFG